ncbi:unnamed protein product [Clonostachys chloroleuca]|uniref:Uncharacterized protein n=1 Tax=Clonostachys chloroleuca TaxID=1926264 RepID=A0AA35QF24_9HYPO|nr:unnamed protein product [Clonostachys chloroleuca]
MELELENIVPETASNRTDIDEVNALLAQTDTNEVRRLKFEATSLLEESHANLVGMNTIDILTVIGNLKTWMSATQQEVIELCLSIAYPLLILQCRSLAKMLASLSTFDDQGQVPDISWHPQQQTVLGRLSRGFHSSYTWKAAWINVFTRWKIDGEDSSWLSAKIDGMRGKIAEISPIFTSIKVAFSEITIMTGVSFDDEVENIERTFEMFEMYLDQCKAKVDELNIEERSKHLLPFQNPPRVQSWTSGANVSSSGIAQRRSFRKRATTSSNQPAVRTMEKLQTKWSQATDLFEPLVQLAKSPVILILTVAMPFTIYSTYICEIPDDLPVVDSNFWSTLSQCIAGFAGLYVVLRPMFSTSQKDKIRTKFPKVFYTMIVLSLTTSIASVLAYVWSPPASIPLAYVSGLALNIATLLIIKDSGNQIKETNRVNEQLEGEVSDLEKELAGYRTGR